MSECDTAYVCIRDSVTNPTELHRELLSKTASSLTLVTNFECTSNTNVAYIFWPSHSVDAFKCSLGFGTERICVCVRDLGSHLPGCTRSQQVLDKFHYCEIQQFLHVLFLYFCMYLNETCFQCLLGLFKTYCIYLLLSELFGATASCSRFGEYRFCIPVLYVSSCTHDRYLNCHFWWC